MSIFQTKAALKPEDDDIQMRLNRTENRRLLLLRILPCAGIVFLTIFFSVACGDKFFNMDNIAILLNQGFTYIVCAAGAALIFSVGSLDFSVGMVSALAQLVVAMLIRNYNISAAAAFFICIGVVVLCMSVTAFISTLLKVPVFVCSLCVLNICNGIIQFVCEKEGILYIDYKKFQYLNSMPLKFAVAVLVVGCIYLLFNSTRLGRDLKALGENSTAARLSGVVSLKTIWLAFTIMGICAGIAAFFTLMRNGSVSATTNSDLHINILTAMVLGGFPIKGGADSKISAPILGAVMLIILTNGLTLMGVDVGMRSLVKGLLYIAVIIIGRDKANSLFVK